jgi:hypothetical protein
VGAVVKATAILVGAGIDERREELVDEVAVGCVDFYEFETSFESAASAFGESMSDASDAFESESFGLNGFRGETLGRGGIDRTPAALSDGDWSAVIAPRDPSGGFESCVGELSSSHRTVLAEETHYACKILYMGVLPDTEVGGTDATL